MKTPTQRQAERVQKAIEKLSIEIEKLTELDRKDWKGYRGRTLQDAKEGRKASAYNGLIISKLAGIGMMKKFNAEFIK